MKSNYHMGIDVGSTTAKMVVTHNNEVIFSRYERHNARVNELLVSYLDDLMQQAGDVQVTLGVTGSVGMATAEQLGAPFVQEVVAATTYARERHPEAKALIDIGGEDAKVVLCEGKHTELRMNGNCAGGTGAFLDQMSQLMGISNQQMNDLAMTAKQVYPLAARCGVFAKTDIQNLMARNLPRPDIAASIFHAIAVQTVTTLSHGCEFKSPILLCGGPLTFMPALRQAFARYLKMEPGDFIVGDNSYLIPAMGCALRPSNCIATLSSLRKVLVAPGAAHTLTAHTLPALFGSNDEHLHWLNDKAKYATATHPMRPGIEKVTLGIDSGSTTTKVVAARLNGEILYTYYAPNLGNPIKAATQGLLQLQQQARQNGTLLEIHGSCSTGYGEELIKAAFGLDHGIIETIAHYGAARRLMPDVTFILDIGGQDMKAIFVDHGVINRMELNEACSSGCGTFLQTFAQSLGYKIGDFATLACTAPNPCDLGTRCTVFMNSKIKQVLREGASVGDIAAGLSYSVVNNCLYKVLKLKSTSEMGKHIVVQGGTMRNDAVVRAFEKLTGCTVARSNMPEMMGAYGCALYAAQNLAAPRTLEGMLQLSAMDTMQLHCKGCDNQCTVMRYTFGNGNKYYSGNRCERVFNNHGKQYQPGLNIYAEKYHLLYDRPAAASAKRRVGVPRVLNMYEDYPFWHRLFTDCGLQVVLSPESKVGTYEAALNTVMSDNICFPAKLVHSHIMALSHMDVERIVMPYVVYEHRDSTDVLNSFNCPIVSGYSDVIRSAMSPNVPVDAPVITFAETNLLRKQVLQYMSTLGVKPLVARKAFDAALAAQASFAAAMQHRAVEILQQSRREHKITILLVGRPYHTDPLIQHRLSSMIASMGVNVISDDIVRGQHQLKSGKTHIVQQWAYMNRIIKAAEWAAEQPDDVQLVQMTSFGCGPDAFIQDEVRDILSRHGKPYTLLKIDDVSNLGSLKLRVRSLLESLRQHHEHGRQAPFVETVPYRDPRHSRKILAPFISQYLSPLLPSLLKLMGYDVDILPPSDQESANLGLQYANNEVCYPATLIVGDFVKALKSGKYDRHNIAVAMTQTGGQCRATSYAGLIKRAMVNAGFEDVPMITLGVSATADAQDNQEAHFDINWKKYVSIIVTTLLYSDTMSKFYHEAVIREREPGMAKKLLKHYMDCAQKAILSGESKRLIALIAQAGQAFNDIVDDRTTEKAGIVGEIFLKFNPFAHQYIEHQLIDHGIEVLPPLITPFFLQDFVNIEYKNKLYLKSSGMPTCIIHLLYHLVARRIDKVNRAASTFRYFIPFDNIYHEANSIEGIVSPAAQFGEGWLLPAEIIDFARMGVKNVISVQPFGCIANHVVSKGIEKALRHRIPDLNLLSLDFDSGVSSVNVTNRLLMFIDNVGQRQSKASPAPSTVS